MMHIAKGVTIKSAAPVSIPGGNPNIKTDHAINNITAADKRLIHLPGRFIELSFDFNKPVTHSDLVHTEVNQPYSQYRSDSNFV